MSDRHLLPSWRPGPTREAVTDFLAEVEEVAPSDRLACFDNDGTLWCERPSYVQLDFFIDALRGRVADAPAQADRPEFAALLSGDQRAVGEIGLERIAMALTGLFEGLRPEEFTAAVREFMARGRHGVNGRLHRTNLYRPMLELVAELRLRDVTVALVTGGGTEFVRAVSRELYGVPPELVVGTLIENTFERDGRDRPGLRRTGRLGGAPNEGTVKVANIQSQLGRRPLLAAGNSGGDREMLEWVRAGAGPSLALLVDHDDADREFAYVSTAETFAEPEPITAVAERLGWTLVSMARDWEHVFEGVDP